MLNNVPGGSAFDPSGAAAVDKITAHFCYGLYMARCGSTQMHVCTTVVSTG